MAKVNVNFKRIARNSKSLKKTGDDIVLKKYEQSKENFFEEFQSHPVTQEIQDGPTASNVSNTLNGVGNLFSFIGFDSSTSPIEDLEKLLKKKFSVKVTRKDETVRYTIDFPTLDKIKSSTPMPFERGNSWVVGIEKGISGFSNYLYKVFVQGRSKEALQAENKIRGSGYKKTRYLSEIINNFIKNMKDL